MNVLTSSYFVCALVNKIISICQNTREHKRLAIAKELR